VKRGSAAGEAEAEVEVDAEKTAASVK
jgi:hypothetical protein